MANSFTSGNLVVSLSGEGTGTTTYGDNQASPLTLAQLTTAGTVVSSFTLPQVATTVNGVAENAISAEYGSSSEGLLQLSADGQSLTIAGYGVNAATYNSAEAGVTGNKGAGGTYGNNALAQTYSVPAGGTNGAPAGVTVVPRVIADIRYDGTVDTSTALLNVDNENNPRSVVTTDGTSFYVAGQGVKGDTTQGLFYATDGASSATAINTANDARATELYNGQLYVSQDSTQPSKTGTSNIATVGTGQPTTASAETALPGIKTSVALANGNGNTVNGSSGTVNLSPESFFFANNSTLYVADGGNPKEGGLGDGGLQKYSLVGGNWQLDYTLSAGLNIQANTITDPGAGGQGTTGLIGLTGKVVGNSVQLYATNATVGDLNQTYLYGINDTLSSTTASQASGESFSTLYTAPADTNVRGVAFAPQAAAVCYAQGTRIKTSRGEIPVEMLAVGDLAVTASGEHRPIRWLGSRLTHCRRHPRSHEVMPVRVAANAFGENRPARDLRVSPGHSLCVDVFGEVLIPTMALINGTTITQEDVDSVTYWHVELESHEIILAENMPAESYLDMGNRAFFAENGVVELDASPDAPAATHADFCRPFHMDGAVVEVVRAQLAARARQLGWRLEEQGLGEPHLVVDGLRVDPQVRGLSARFIVPAGAEAVWIVSSSSVPAAISTSSDTRTLGVCLNTLTIDDGFGNPLAIAVDDPRLCDGLHGVENEGGNKMRWTDGRAHLPASLWAGVEGDFFLRVELAFPALPRWIAPAAAAHGSGSLALVG